MYSCLLPLLLVGIILIICYNKYYSNKHNTGSKNNSESNKANSINSSDSIDSTNSPNSPNSIDSNKSIWDDPIEAARLAEEIENKWKTRIQTMSRMEQMKSQGEDPLNQEWMQESSIQANRMSSKMGVNTAANKDKIDI